MEESPRDAEGLPGAISAASRTDLSFCSKLLLRTLVQGQNGLCPFSFWQLFPYASAQLITLGKILSALRLLSRLPGSHCRITRQ